jgi:glycosyltransferase involved in cell wall biosynthesis
MVNAPRTLVIIPAFNEEASLPIVLDDLRRRWPSFDVMVVDDGSTDATAKVARDAGVVVAVLPYNLGIGGALRTGFRFAVQQGYERGIQFDADGQHDAREIPALLRALDDGADMVVGSRFADSQSGYSVGRVRGSAMRFLRLGVRLLLGRSFTDTSSGFRAFSRRALEYFAHTYPVDYMDSVEALLLACYAGFRVTEIPARMHTRTAGVASTRSIRLAYHFVRLTVVMLASASRRGREPKGVPA